MQVAARGRARYDGSAGAMELTGRMHDVQRNWARVDEFLAREGLRETTAALLEEPETQRLSSLCLIEHDGRVLMLRRLKEPFAGYWTAPGGKLLPHEDPREAVLREVREETELVLEEPELRLIASETGPEYYNWLLFFSGRGRKPTRRPRSCCGARAARGRACWTGCRRTGCLNSGCPTPNGKCCPTSSPKTAPRLTLSASVTPPTKASPN